jgi:hypothetical protein
MPGLAPFVGSTNGFAFTNSWPNQPAVILKTPFGKVDVGNAGGGLCGGMVFAAMDYWAVGALPPTKRPAMDDPLYKFIVRRLVDSWNLPAGVAQYYQWMTLPDGDTGFNAGSRKVVVSRGLAWRTIKVQWPQIKADLDRGLPCALGIVTVASKKPKDLAFNHQVLAYGYDASGRTVTIKVYDPNRGQRDDIAITFSVADATKRTEFGHNLGLKHPVRGVFRTAYAPSPPPPTL